MQITDACHNPSVQLKTVCTMARTRDHNSTVKRRPATYRKKMPLWKQWDNLRGCSAQSLSHWTVEELLKWYDEDQDVREMAATNLFQTHHGTIAQRKIESILNE